MIERQYEKKKGKERLENVSKPDLSCNMAILMSCRVGTEPNRHSWKDPDKEYRLRVPSANRSANS